MSENEPPFQLRVRRGPPEPEPIALDIVYEDDCLVAINKPAGIVVHPTYRNWTGTVLNGLLWRHKTPSIITRIDKETSGLVIAALRPDVHARVQKDGSAGHMSKEYLALVHGVPSPTAGTIALPLARSPDDRRRVIVDPGGQASETRYETISSDGEWSVVRCELVTGRTHQIRVHLASSGWPIAGDPVYGRPHPEIQRQALHAWRVKLPHPMTRETLEIEARVPSDIDSVLLRSRP